MSDESEATPLLASQHQSPTYTRSATSLKQRSRASSLSRGLRASRPLTRSNSIAGVQRWLHSSGLRTPRPWSSMTSSMFRDERLWYDQYNCTDWVRDNIAEGYRLLALRKAKGIRGRLHLLCDSAQGWILVAIIGLITAVIAYVIDISESAIFDFKRGYCKAGVFRNRIRCCASKENCKEWRTWAEVLSANSYSFMVNYTAFIIGCVVLATLAGMLALLSKTNISPEIASTFDENFAAGVHTTYTDENNDDADKSGRMSRPPSTNTYYPAAGSGVAEVKVILSGFVLHGYLGLRTLSLKVVGLILSVASGMSVGKEGPYVHIATCVGNIACRIFPKFNYNDSKRREVLSASAAAGIAVAFGSPLAGVVFSLEEVSYFFPAKTLFRTFFCSIVAALSLKFLNPYGTRKIVLFEVRYENDWHYFELVIFIFLGCLGGALGALFIKASRFWATHFRRIPAIKSHPLLEVFCISLTTGIVSFWNRYARLAVAELLLEVASPCTSTNTTGLCQPPELLPATIKYLTIAFLIKAFLTTITFGVKVPAGIYVPSMVVGGLLGRIIGHAVQYLIYQFPEVSLWSHCSKIDGVEACVTPGIYALAAAGATMCGVTRLTITLAVILFELTGSLDHVLPFSIGIMFAKWTADALEPLSIYDLLTDMNSYPFLDNKTTHVFESELSDITPQVHSACVIDITLSPLVRATELRSKVARLQKVGEFDGGLPILRNNVLVGLIPVPDLELVLDKLEDENNTLCLMSSPDHAHHNHAQWNSGMFDDEDESSEGRSVTSNERAEESVASAITIDFTDHVDHAPIALDMHSPMSLVHQCFVKLGLRYICVLEDGQFRGMVHKKRFVKFVKEFERKMLR